MKKKQGGKRKGAGRKPLADKRVAIRFFPLQSEVDKCGGEDSTKEIALRAVITKARKNVR